MSTLFCATPPPNDELTALRAECAALRTQRDKFADEAVESGEAHQRTIERLAVRDKAFETVRRLFDTMVLERDSLLAILKEHADCWRCQNRGVCDDFQDRRDAALREGGLL